MKRKALLLLSIITSWTVGAQTPRLVFPVGHTDNITHIIFSLDGKQVITGSKDKTVKIWDTYTGKLLADLKGHTSAIETIALNKAGTRLLTTASLDTNSFLWDVQTARLVTTLHNRSYNQSIFSPDGKLIFKTTSGEEPVLYNAANGQPQVFLQTWERYTNEAAFSPDGRLIITDQGEIFEASTGRLLHKLESKGAKNILFTPDSKTIIAATLDKTIMIWDTSGNRKAELKGHKEYLGKLLISPDGKRLVSVGLGANDVFLWDVEKAVNISAFKGADNYFARKVQFSADGKTIYATGTLGTTYWDAADGSRSPKLATPPDELFPLSPTEPKMAVVTGERSVAIKSTKTKETIVTLAGPGNELRSAYTTQPGTILNTNYYGDGSPTLFWNLRQLPLSPFTKYGKDISHVAYNHDGQKMVTIRKYSPSDNDEWRREDEVSLWDAGNATLIKRSLREEGMQALHATLSYDDKKFFFIKNKPHLWILNPDWYDYLIDAHTGKLIKSIKHQVHRWDASINEDGTRIATRSPDGIFVVNTETSETVATIKDSKEANKPPTFIPYKNRHLVEGYPIHRLYEDGGTKPILQFGGKITEWNSAKTKLIAISGDTISVWNLVNTKKELQFIKPKDSRYYTDYWDAVWSADEQSIIYSLNKAEVKRISIKDGSVQAEGACYAMTFQWSADKQLLFCFDDDVVTVLHPHSLKEIACLKGHTNQVVSAMRLPDSSKILTVGKDYTARVWNLNSGNLIYTQLLLQQDFQLSLLPSSYYQANPAAARLLHYVTPDLKVITFDQLDVRYNRPDKVLEAVGSKDTALITAYRKAYEKRIKKLGVDTTAFAEGYSVPVSDFTERDKITYEQTTGTLTLHIKSRDSAYALDRFNLWVNEAPLYGSKGLNLRNRNRSTFDTTITVLLNNGINNIETSVSNTNGTESYRIPLTVSYTPAQPKAENLYFMGIGINRFKEARNNLNYSVKDIRDLALKLKEKYGSAVIIDTLFDEAVTASSIAALKKRLQSTTIDDKVVLAYSGHGLLSKNYDYYLSTYNVNFKNPEQGGVPYEDLESLMDGIPARKKLMLVDACHSGEVDKEEMEKLETGKASLKEKGTVMKGADEDSFQTDTKLGIKNSFELMQELFVNVGRSTGTTVISAAAGTQFAQERDELQNGVFTYSILEFMKKGEAATISNLRSYVNRRVTELTNGLQVPTTRAEVKSVDWRVW